MPDFIFDNSVLSDFAAISRTELLARLFKNNGFTTFEVVEELRRGIDRGYLLLAPALDAAESSSGWLEVLALKTSQESVLRRELDQILHPGESSCVAIAISRGVSEG